MSPADPTRSSTRSDSITGSYVMAALLAVALLLASYPLAVGLASLVLLAVALTARGVWRRAGADGVGLPGSTTRLCVAGPTQCVSDGTGRCYSLTIQLTDR